MPALLLFLAAVLIVLMMEAGIVTLEQVIRGGMAVLALVICGIVGARVAGVAGAILGPVLGLIVLIGFCATTA